MGRHVLYSSLCLLHTNDSVQPTADMASVHERMPATPLTLHRTARVRDTALHIPLKLGLQLLHQSPQDCSHWVVSNQQLSHQVDFVSSMFCYQKWAIFLKYGNKMCTIDTILLSQGKPNGELLGHNCY